MNVLSVIRSRNVYLDKSSDATTAHRHSIYVKSNTCCLVTHQFRNINKTKYVFGVPQKYEYAYNLILFFYYLNEHVNVKRVH